MTYKIREALKKIKEILEEDIEERDKFDSREKRGYYFVYQQWDGRQQNFFINDLHVIASGEREAFYLLGLQIEAFHLTIRNIRYGFEEECESILERYKNDNR